MLDLLHRRDFLYGTAIAAIAGTSNSATARPAVTTPTSSAAPAEDEDYWRTVAEHYEVSRDFINLENAYYGIMSKPVSDEFKRNIDKLNLDNSHFLRREFDRDGIEAIRTQLAHHLGVPADEIAITRGATESLQNLISNYKLVRRGDTVLYGDLDYDAMQYAMNDLAERRGARVSIVRVPEPATRKSVLDAYEHALVANPRARLLLLTHISHRTGLVFPVEELMRMAKRRGVDVIVDVAQSWGQLDFRLPDLQADFVGGNLHKWIGAPLGLGFIYIRKSRLADIGVHLGDRDYAATDIRSRVHSGTLNAASIMTVPAALAWHAEIGTPAKGARLRYLRDYWVTRVRDHGKIQILTPDAAGMSGAITSFRIAGKSTPEDNIAIARRLIDEFGIFTVTRHGPVGGSCIRVTPALFTRPQQLDRLVLAINSIAAA
jgi:selenocysteine lyase/cysteine desulfurase